MARRPRMGQRDRRIIWDWQPKFDPTTGVMTPGTRLPEEAPPVIPDTTAPGARLPEPAPVPTMAPGAHLPEPAPGVVPDTVDVRPKAPIETLETWGERDLSIKDAEFREWLESFIKELQRETLNKMRDVQVMGSAMFTGMVTGNFGPWILSPLMMYNDFLTFDSYSIEIAITPPDTSSSGTISFDNGTDSVSLILSDALMSIDPGADNQTALDIGTTSHRYKNVDIYGTTDVNFVAYGSSSGYPRGYFSAEQSSGVYGKASMYSAYSALDVATINVYAANGVSYLEVDADEIRAASADVTYNGTSTKYWARTYTKIIYRDTEMALSCLPDKKNIYLGKDSIEKLKNIKAINVNGNWGKTDPETIPEDLRGPLTDWGDEKDIATIDMTAWDAYICAGLIDLDEKVTVGLSDLNELLTTNIGDLKNDLQGAVLDLKNDDEDIRADLVVLEERIIALENPGP